MHRIQVSNVLGKQHHRLTVHPSHLLAFFLLHSHSISFLFCHQRLSFCTCLPQPVSRSDLALRYFHSLSIFLILPMCLSFPFSSPFSFILIYLTNLQQTTTLTSYSSENLKKILRWISFTALCPQGTHGLLWERDEHMVTMQSVHMCAIYVYTHLCDVYISAYTHGWSLIIIPFLLSALSNHNIVRVAWHSYFYLSALKSSSHAALRLISLKYCSCKFLSKTEMSSKWFPPK